MGCVQSSGREEAVTKVEEPPKAYSWDRKDKVDPADFTLEGLRGEEAGRVPGTINGQQFIIQNCQSSQIFLLDHINTITIDDCSDCTIFIGPTTGSVFVRDCQECVVVGACGQFRTRDCCRLEVYLLCQTQPIIEASSKMKFGCFQAFYPQLKEHFSKASLSVFNNNWSNVYDFTPVDGETNWSTITQPSALPHAFPLPRTQSLASVGLSVVEESSVVPYTLGSPQYHGQEAALVILFYDSDQHHRATTFIAGLRSQVADCRIQHSREVKMEAVDAVRVFQGSEHKAAVSRGPIIALLCLGTDVHQACTVLAHNTGVYVTPDSSIGHRQIDSFFSYASMSMTM
ncbi:protein XRP2-like [Portunus trituberculatus]|uniref:protein XRP2-like n=1 Tax=Portunus trituberculatus TaxID=210409 RepID=UPI001E1CBDBA|nr:protein XRP2-like [Portunus trituberculatus]